MTKRVGIPDNVVKVWPQPDTIPVEFHLPKCCYAYWITEELMKECEDG